MFKFGFSAEQHLGLRYGHCYENGKKVRRPWPRGMSGGAMWLWTGGTPRLAGIFTTFEKTRSLLLGTRLHVMIEAIIRQLGKP